ncbi:tetratricopeptide repeat protein [Kitasatospora purpeofusca]|uniref:tetratricopeptide repeat protein n=1 Tax=Kitasatospora purpeofusca TaxID=67352 RepID=UPI002E0FF4BB|nr:tetratricopeptide repeat protein [Kitasatospora purpeofusca]WSR38405.1 tetratricopeptide repeat protein [Kitasatospora purpeofusca]
MVERLVVDLHADGRMLVTEQPSGEMSPAPAVDAGWLRRPLADAPMESLRWYLEDYLRTPLGAYGERGPQIARQLPDWGARVFSALFGTGPGRDAYLRARGRGGGLEIVLRSGSAQLLALPWELMTDPERPVPLVLDDVVLSRRTPGTEDGGSPAPRTARSRLRVLLVVATPDDPARPDHRPLTPTLLRFLRAEHAAVEPTVLRPPTPDRLAEVLHEAREEGRPFHVLHFDGPGPTDVPATVPVPLVVLTTGRSAPEPGLPEAVAASRLLQGGAHAVLALPYHLDAPAAAGFLAICYERLRTGDPVALAVAAGRRRLATQDRRTSPRGPLPLADWTVPALYSRPGAALPGPDTAGAVQLADEHGTADATAATEPPDTPDHHDEFAPVGGFVGRDGLLLGLDTATRRHRVVLLHGAAGIGKSELAKAFGRWCRETGAVDGPDAVVLHAFETGAAGPVAAGVVERIGRRLFAPEEFDPLPPAERRAAVEQALTTRRLLLIWDDVDSLASDPEVPDEERAGLRALLDLVARQGSSTVLLTSRTHEDWLGPAALRIEVPGLDPGETVEFAEHLLAPSADSTGAPGSPDTVRRRGLRVFGELLEWLGGHPLAMRLALSSLDSHEPWQTLDTLVRGAAALPGSPADGSPPPTPEAVPAALTLSTDYALARLGAADRRALSAVSLVHGVADATVLALLSRHPLAPERFRGLGTEDWQRLLLRAAELGLLAPCGRTAYRVHPTVAARLAAGWRAAGPGFAEQHEAGLQALLGAQVNFCLLLSRELHNGSAEFALTALDLQRPSIGAMLARALDRGLWLQALALVRPLHEHWNARGTDLEARHWIDRVRTAVEEADGTPPVLDSPAGSLWLYVVGADARRLLRLGVVDGAERALREIHRAAELHPPGAEQLDELADCHQRLGGIAVDRGDFGEAEEWYLRSQALLERLGDVEGLAIGHHQLGVIAQRLGRPDDAERLVRQALDLFERLGETGRAAACHHRLGVLAEEQGRFEDAHGCFGRALAAVRATAVGAVADLSVAAELHHRLAAVAAELGRLDEAEDWCERALDLAEESGSRAGAADAHHRLGVLAAARERFAEAEARYRKALEIRQDLGDLAGTALGEHQLGLVATQRGDLAEAERRHTRALALREELGDRVGVSAGHHQLGLTAQAGGRAADAEARYRKALEVSHRIGDTPGLARTFGQFGLFAAEQGRPREAMEWLVRSITAFEEFPHPATWPSVVGLRRLAVDLGPRSVERAWRTVTGRRLPDAVREQVAD